MTAVSGLNAYFKRDELTTTSEGVL